MVKTMIFAGFARSLRFCGGDSETMIAVSMIACSPPVNQIRYLHSCNMQS